MLDFGIFEYQVLIQTSGRISRIRPDTWSNISILYFVAHQHLRTFEWIYEIKTNVYKNLVSHTVTHLAVLICSPFGRTVDLITYKICKRHGHYHQNDDMLSIWYNVVNKRSLLITITQGIRFNFFPALSSFRWKENKIFSFYYLFIWKK